MTPVLIRNCENEPIESVADWGLEQAIADGPSEMVAVVRASG